MDSRDIYREWFEVADKDLASAEFLQKMKPVPLEIICYHCQQCAEKYLKGFLAFKEEQITKTHDLVLLNKLYGRYDEGFEEIDENCLLLTDFDVNMRYPFHIEINKSDMKTAFSAAKRIKKFIFKNINSAIDVDE